MFNRDGSFTVHGKRYETWRHTSDGLVAVFNTSLTVWQYFRLNWRTEAYDLVGSTVEFYDPNLAAFDRSEVFPVVH